MFWRLKRRGTQRANRRRVTTNHANPGGESLRAGAQKAVRKNRAVGGTGILDATSAPEGKDQHGSDGIAKRKKKKDGWERKKNVAQAVKKGLQGRTGQIKNIKIQLST